MKTAFVIALCVASFVFTVFAADPPATSVPLKFVPVKSTDGKQASFSELHPFPSEDSKTLAVQAHAGIGDQFPVQQKDHPAFFEVLLVDGDNDHLVLEVRTKVSTHKVELKRDKTVELQVTGIKFRFLFPTVSVSSAAKAKTTNQAFLIVARDG